MSWSVENHLLLVAFSHATLEFWNMQNLGHRHFVEVFVSADTSHTSFDSIYNKKLVIPKLVSVTVSVNNFILYNIPLRAHRGGGGSLR